MNTTITKKDRFLGCFLGGAVGDALGYPVEFVDEKYIWKKYGPQGIQTLAQAGDGEDPAVITDDTQMTLFVINGLLYGKTSHQAANGSCAPNQDWISDQDAVWLAHQEWLGTQGDTSRMKDPQSPRMWIYRDSRLHALRAPGGTCLSSIRENEHGGSLSHKINNSKGCGAVMKAAPLGLIIKFDPVSHMGDYLIGVYKYSADLGAQTHGHPLGYMSASALAVMLAAMVHYRPGEYKTLQDAILHSFTGSHDACHEIYAGLKQAITLALDPTVSDLDGIHQLGEGWVAEEALYIAVFCAVRYQNDFARAIRVAVNHKGDSDSTGSICGNILGAWLGVDAVRAAFDLKDLEMQDLIEEIATDFCQAVEHGIPVGDAQWDSKYRCGKKLSSNAKPLERIHMDVTCGVLDFDKIHADVVVCPTDTRLSGSGGLDRQIHLRAGMTLEGACRTLRQQKEIASGDVHVTSGYDLTAKWIAHAVTPAPQFDKGQIVNQQDLIYCYTNCLRTMVREPACKGITPDHRMSIAMPLLGTGNLGWPVEISLSCAWNAIITFVGEQAGSGWHACHSYEIRLCSTEKHLPLIRPYLQRWSTAFFTIPEQWGYRGDIYLWQQLMTQFDHPRSYSQRESLPRFMEMIRMQLEELLAPTGLRPESHAYVKELDHGGMSGGGINGDFWLLRGLPLICESFCQRQLGSFNDYDLKEFVWPKFYQMENEHCLWQLPEDMHEALIGMRSGISVFDSLRDFTQNKHSGGQTSAAVAPALVSSASPAVSSPKPAAISNTATEEHAAEIPSPTPLRPVGLLYSDRTKRALKISYRAHEGQMDKGGIPYALHPLHLAEQMETEDEICTALLHDVLEDTDYTENDLRKAGITEPVLAALRLLTHDHNTPYMEYVIGTRQNPLARKVKQADLLHNSDINRMDQVTTFDLRRRRKYRIAQAVLEDDYYDSFCKHYRKRIPLDDDRRYFLSVFYHRNDAVQDLVPGTIIKYSLDVEKAGDSHYEFGPSDSVRLQKTLDTGYTGIRRSLPESLAQFFETHGEMSFTSLLHQLGIKYQQFHFD